jgi:hypothetical protein
MKGDELREERGDNGEVLELSVISRRKGKEFEHGKRVREGNL